MVFIVKGFHFNSGTQALAYLAFRAYSALISVEQLPKNKNITIFYVVVFVHVFHPWFCRKSGSNVCRGRNSSGNCSQKNLKNSIKKNVFSGKKNCRFLHEKKMVKGFLRHFKWVNLDVYLYTRSLFSYFFQYCHVDFLQKFLKIFDILYKNFHIFGKN